ncbi:M61 family metallopeptidase [Gaetbulibacter aestuarii]|uniref:PDZ domain-containing protein n=1 Tax=Gaetbulibacter aestuarii TaxID=1502358 RepID=A0ABW7MW00_9FLAO
MNRIFPFLLLVSFYLPISAQTATNYNISFENAVHHEAKIEATFTQLTKDTIIFEMSRASPGRYALHEFAKNVYGVSVTNSKGDTLKFMRPDPYSWKVTGHDGTIHVTYTLFANRGGGTYSQFDETHAHMNMPATFMYAPDLADQGIQVTFNPREDLNWKVATQLKHQNGNTYYAPNLQYFMDSPTEISDYSKRSFKVHGQTVNFVLHHNGTDAELDAYFEMVKKVVLQEEAVYGTLAPYDYGAYTFLACYIPNASGDGMEHRNSTICTSTRSLAADGANRNIGTVSHEFFHSWNVERIRPKTLEPFDFQHANMSGALWFAEGFTQYYTNLILTRAGIMTPKDYVTGLSRTFNYVWNSPARQFFTPIGMSQQAPFVDAATSVDPVNRVNTFISYYSYGNMLGLALDLSLREEGLNLDDFMKKMWNNFGKTEIPYTIQDIQNTLTSYAGKDFADHFFGNYIYKSDMPNMKTLLNTVGVSLTQDPEKVDFGASVEGGFITENTIMGGAAYQAGLENGDQIIKVDTTPVLQTTNFGGLIQTYHPGDKVKVIFNRFGKTKETTVTLQASKDYALDLFEASNTPVSAKQKAMRDAWLESKHLP